MGCSDQPTTPAARNRRNKKADATDDQAASDKTEAQATINYVKLFHTDGRELFVSDIPDPGDSRAMIPLWPQVIRQALDNDIDLTGLDMSGKYLAGVDLRGLNLYGIDFSASNLENADLRNCNMRGCILQNTDLDNARMTNVDLTGATIYETTFSHVEARDIFGIVMLCELDDYFVWAYPKPINLKNIEEGVELRVRAGCRDFSLDEAREHWADQPDRREIFAALGLLEVIANKRGWKTRREPVPGDDEA